MPRRRGQWSGRRRQRSRSRNAGAASEAPSGTQRRPGSSPLHRSLVYRDAISEGQQSSLVHHFRRIAHHVSRVKPIGHQRFANTGRWAGARDADPQIPILGATERRIEAADGRQNVRAHHDVRATGSKRVPARQQSHYVLWVSRRAAAQDA